MLLLDSPWGSGLWCDNAPYRAWLYSLCAKILSRGSYEVAQALYQLESAHWKSWYHRLSMDLSVTQKALCISTATAWHTLTHGEDTIPQNRYSNSPSRLPSEFCTAPKYQIHPWVLFWEILQTKRLFADQTFLETTKKKLFAVRWGECQVYMSCSSFETYSLFISTILSLQLLYIYPLHSAFGQIDCNINSSHLLDITLQTSNFNPKSSSSIN
jgi:hypothetical protein